MAKFARRLFGVAGVSQVVIVVKKKKKNKTTCQ